MPGVALALFAVFALLGFGWRSWLQHRLQLAGVVSPLNFLHAPWIQLTGIVVAVVGIAATVYAQVAVDKFVEKRG